MWNLTGNNFYLILVLRCFNECCDCGKKDITNMNKKIEIFDSALEKRELLADNNKFSTKKVLLEIVTHSVSTTTTLPTTIDSTPEMTITTELEEVNKKSEETEEEIIEGCPYFKKLPSNDLQKIVDVWQTTFYRASAELSCFKIYVRRTTTEEQRYNEQTYGNFNNTVDWNNCIFEVRSNDKHFPTKHFLHKDDNDYGILDNIIMIDERDGNKSTISLKEESPNQWMVIKNLLLMRDCESGDIVVFSRVPHDPKLADIHDAFKAFGEKNFNGTYTCVKDKEVSEQSPVLDAPRIKEALRDVFSRFGTMLNSITRR